MQAHEWGKYMDIDEFSCRSSAFLRFAGIRLVMAKGVAPYASVHGVPIASTTRYRMAINNFQAVDGDGSTPSCWATTPTPPPVLSIPMCCTASFAPTAP